MSHIYPERQVNRRSFLKKAAATALAATAAGAGAAWLQPRRANTPLVIAPPAATTPAISINTANNQTPDLLTQLAALQAENSRLQADLEAARSSLDAQQLAAGETNTAVQTMSVELDKANDRIGVLAGLVALYEQLDNVDVPALLADGVGAVSTAITDVVEDLPGLDEGIALGRQALAEMDGQIPLLENGRHWLTSQTSKMAQYFTAVEELLPTVTNRAGPFLQMFTEWVQSLLKWLPFGLGQHTVAIMDGLTNLLLEIPHTLTGLDTNLAGPLDLWLGKAGEETPLRQNIIKPIENRVLKKGDRVVEKTRQLQTTYQEKVVQSLETAVARHRHIRDLIIAYRQQHQL